MPTVMTGRTSITPTVMTGRTSITPTVMTGRTSIERTNTLAVIIAGVWID